MGVVGRCGYGLLHHTYQPERGAQLGSRIEDEARGSEIGGGVWWFGVAIWLEMKSSSIGEVLEGEKKQEI